ncbi:hypothetical protein [Xanthomonas translucens]|uniref:hypothetical protein n=1 Tax=Xanthomonas campestris pv. translucens TaxID=343 RepID=UPI001F19D1CD|nr:hypothetical protein [Xanthomonas translucens]UJB14636.1 hypothetical protein LTC53_17065 [Xanthomonas translucens pv. undulosa]WLA11839.1 hypothetical protein MO327_16965 [Xanthomonas translucens]
MLFYPGGSLQYARAGLGLGGVAAHPFTHAPHDFAGDHALSLEAPAFSLDPDRHAVVLARDSYPVYALECAPR